MTANNLYHLCMCRVYPRAKSGAKMRRCDAEPDGPNPAMICIRFPPETGQVPAVPAWVRFQVRRLPCFPGFPFSAASPTEAAERTPVLSRQQGAQSSPAEPQPRRGRQKDGGHPRGNTQVFEWARDSLSASSQKIRYLLKALK